MVVRVALTVGAQHFQDVRDTICLCFEGLVGTNHAFCFVQVTVLVVFVRFCNKFASPLAALSVDLEATPVKRILTQNWFA